MSRWFGLSPVIGLGISWSPGLESRSVSMLVFRGTYLKLYFVEFACFELPLRSSCDLLMLSLGWCLRRNGSWSMTFTGPRVLGFRSVAERRCWEPPAYSILVRRERGSSCMSSSCWVLFKFDLAAAASSRRATLASIYLIVCLFLKSLAFFAFSRLKVSFYTYVKISESSKLSFFFTNPWIFNTLPLLLHNSDVKSPFEQTSFYIRPPCLIRFSLLAKHAFRSLSSRKVPAFLFGIIDWASSSWYELTCLSLLSNSLIYFINI